MSQWVTTITIAAAILSLAFALWQFSLEGGGNQTVSAARLQPIDRCHPSWQPNVVGENGISPGGESDHYCELVETDNQLKAMASEGELGR